MKKSSMKKSIALGLALAMGTSLLTACGGSATTSSSEQTSSAIVDGKWTKVSDYSKCSKFE